jgi:hypothetical protein
VSLNIKLGRKFSPGTNTLAYLAGASVPKKKKFKKYHTVIKKLECP